MSSTNFDPAKMVVRPAGVQAWYLNPEDWEGPDGGPEIPDWILQQEGVIAVGYGDGFDCCIVVRAEGLWPDMLVQPHGNTKPPLSMRRDSHWKHIQKWVSLAEGPASIRFPKKPPFYPGSMLPQRVGDAVKPYIQAAAALAAQRREARMAAEQAG